MNLTKKELKILNTPKKIQDFLNKLKINYEEGGMTLRSPKMVLEKRECDCIEGALLAAAILKLNGYKPLIVDLVAARGDFDHVIAVFQENGKYGCISKTNHAVLRYREPVYRDIRELAMSFFHEYFDDKGKKTLRSFSIPIDLSIFDKKNWIGSEKNLWYIYKHIRKAKHFPILGENQAYKLRKADKVEIKAGKLLEWKKS